MLGRRSILAQKIFPKSGGSPYKSLAVASLLPLFGVMAAFGVAPHTQTEDVPLHEVVEQITLPPLTSLATAETEFWREERVRRGDTIGSLLSRLEVQDDDAFKFLRTNKAASPLYHLKPGTPIQAAVSEDGALMSLRYLTSSGEQLRVERDGNGFSARVEAPPLRRYLVMGAAQIRTSLYQASDDANIPDHVASQIADIFSSEIDFHHELRGGDRFAVIYEVFYSSGEQVKVGRVMAAEFVNQGELYQAVYFRRQDGESGYYTPYGVNLRKAFLKSPLEFSRISSGFSISRFHPVLQTWRAHKGIDYAAPVGTRVRATADGVVAFAGVQSGYGNVVMLDHHGKYSTVYGHLSAFASGLRKGQRVAQGDIIGNVGATGMATGPHLHYELRKDGVAHDPVRIATPPAPPITSQLRPEFDRQAAVLSRQLTQARAFNLAVLD